MFRFCLLALIAICSMTLHMSAANADVIFSNFGHDQTFGIFSYGFGHVPGETSRAYTASAFTVPAGQSFQLDALTLAVAFSLLQPSPQPFEVFVLDNSPTGTPGGIIESFTQTITAPVSPSLFTITSTSHPILADGGQYWIALTTGSVTFPMISGAWVMNSIGDTGPVAQGTDLAALRPLPRLRPAFEIDGTAPAAIPEPSGVLLLGSGLLALCLIRRRPAGLFRRLQI